jgi:hypothetical protein
MTAAPSNADLRPNRFKLFATPTPMSANVCELLVPASREGKCPDKSESFRSLAVAKAREPTFEKFELKVANSSKAKAVDIVHVCPSWDEIDPIRTFKPSASTGGKYIPARMAAG